MAMTPVPRLGELIGCAALTEYTDPGRWFGDRDEIKALLADHLATQPTAHWLALLEPADVWCADVLTWPRLMEHHAFKALGMTQEIRRGDRSGTADDALPDSDRRRSADQRQGSPRAGEQTAALDHEFRLSEGDEQR